MALKACFLYQSPLVRPQGEWPLRDCHLAPKRTGGCLRGPNTSQPSSQPLALGECRQAEALEWVPFAKPLPHRVPKASSRKGVISMAAPKMNLWRTRNMGREAVEVAQDLVWAKGDETKVALVLREKASRLVKADLVAVLEELERQDRWQLALKVFDLVRNEIWYEPETALYAKIIDCLGRSHQQEMALRLFREMQSEGGQPKDTTYTALIGAFCRDSLYEEGIKLLREMQEAGVPPYDLTYKILIEACENAGAEEEARELAEERTRVCGTDENTPVKEILKISRRM